MRPFVLGFCALLLGSAGALAADPPEPRGYYGPPPSGGEGYGQGGYRFGGQGPAPALDPDDDEDDADGPERRPEEWAAPVGPGGECWIRQTPLGPERLCR